ncbi:MAG TPA: dockerin type I domain-containing protein [Phycisphaerae bacterium]|nr:dockerin type I domain-containing protein [Phycisphaerae bacterium]HRY67756.1 dockerin type I domain-containing protein [Phycisphaerae bacterium]HSA25208.1 dockerin type I domain-containing protein [Phycisphaerae bacterium]
MRTLITVAAALAVLVGSQAYGAISIDYKLELGGKNFATDYHTNGTFPAYERGSDADGKTFDNAAYPDGAVADWAVVVAMPGLDDVTGTYAAGAANLVFDLELHEGTADGPLVAIGHGGPTMAGFFSTINDGTTDPPDRVNPVQDAAFPSVFDVDGAGASGGRLFDVAASGGPGMTFKTYPSDAGHPAASTAPQGKLVGMGAGYEELDPVAGLGVAGVAIPEGEPFAGFCTALGVKALFEGQINLKGLNGTYVLVLKAGVGNNVARTSSTEFPICDSEIEGSFAVAAPTVNEDTITFSVTGGGEPCQAPVMTAAESVKTHTGIGDFVVSLFPTKQNECRRNGPTKVVVTFDRDIKLVTGTAADVAVSSGAVSAVAAAGNKLTVTMSGAANAQLLTMTFPGVADGTACVGSAVSASSLCIGVQEGDVGNNGTVNTLDMTVVRNNTGADMNLPTTNFRADINSDGKINTLDMTRVRNNIGNPGTKCP